MIRRIIPCGVLVLTMVLALSCSGLNEVGQPAMPGEPVAGMDVGRTSGGHNIMGLWQIRVDKHTGEGEITRLRSIDQLLNVLTFMEPPPLSALSINWATLVLDQGGNYLEVVVNFTHPFMEPDNVFVGFDVRGIVFGPELLNADGYTPVLSPQFFSGLPFGYVDGLLGVKHSFAGYKGSMWPYKYFAKGIDPYESLSDYYSIPSHFDDRGHFPEGATISRFYQLDFGPLPGKFLVFNYGVLASFDWPIGTPPYDLNDFGITTANAPEPFNASFTIVENTLYYGGGSGGGRISFDAEVFDWQGASSTEVTIESVDGVIIPKTPATSSEPGGNPYSTIFHFIDVPGTPTQPGELNLLLTATDPNVTYGETWLFGLMPSSNSFYDKPVYTVFPISGIVEVAENAPPTWTPVLSLAAGFGTLCRDGSPYGDVYSTYDYTTRWDYTGGEPYDPEGGAMTKWYYISTSPTTQVGSPVGWVQFATVGYIEMNWQFYATIAPDRLYLWVRAEDELGVTSNPERWTNDGGEIELCHVVKGWDNFPPGHWAGTGGTAGNWVSLSVPATPITHAWLYNDELWVLGSIATTSAIKVEWSRYPSAWTLNANELSFRVSNNGALTPVNDIQTWTGSYGIGGIMVITLPSTIGGTNTIGSSRTFGFYLTDKSTAESGVCYVDYMGIYSHPL